MSRGSTGHSHRSSDDPRRLILVATWMLVITLGTALLATILLAVLGRPVPSVLEHVLTTALGYLGGVLGLKLRAPHRNQH